MALLAGCDPRLRLHIVASREALLPGRPYGDALITTGFVASAPPGRPIPPGEPPRRFVLRHPVHAENWNGALVIAAHRDPPGGSDGDSEEGDSEAGPAFGPDRLVGSWALDRGFAWAAFDRAGAGGGAGGRALTEAFARLMSEQIRPRIALEPERVILLGIGEGGGIARNAASAPGSEPLFDGAVLASATGADPAAEAGRARARRALGMPDPSLPDSHPEVAARAAAVGIPPAGRRFWPFFHLVGPVGDPGAPPAAPATLRIPVVEVAGALDDLVLPEVLAFRDRVVETGSGDLYDLRIVPGAWHAGPGDRALPRMQAEARRRGLAPEQTAALASGASLAPDVRQALADLDARLRSSGSEAGRPR